MSITRRGAMTAVMGCGLTATAKADQEPATPQRDPIVASLPAVVRKVFIDTFPHHRCIRMARRGQGDTAVYRGTFFQHTVWSSTEVRLVGEESVSTPPLFHLEVDAAGKVLEETLRMFEEKNLPQAVLAAYQKWNPKGVVGRSGHFWQTELPRGKTRIYRINILMSAVKAYRAAFSEDGTAVSASPAVIPE